MKYSIYSICAIIGSKDYSFVDSYWEELSRLGLSKKYKNVRLSVVANEDWVRKCFLFDPSGILWHYFRKFSNLLMT